ncbi:MAG: hypothetical protein PHP21_02920 [Patescibacteria group bacterium]|nr:hypothetical protein [Patescibacteria group bacterium]MDD5554855.1 hypothetical protein [Patescibacteria group bacterium]
MLFWTAYYLINGSVPVVNSAKITKNWILVLPLEISRWWDIFLGPVWSALFLYIVTDKYMRAIHHTMRFIVNPDFDFTGARKIFRWMLSLVTVGLLVLLIFSLISDIVIHVLIFGLAILCVISLSTFIRLKAISHVVFFWIIDLSFLGLAISLRFGLIFGLITILFWFLISNLMISLILKRIVPYHLLPTEP